MRSLKKLKALTVLFGAAALLSSCLVSEEPVLEKRTGRARPFDDGAYRMCPIEDEAGAEDCDRLTAQFNRDTGEMMLLNEDEPDDPAILRFRHIGRRAYAVQSYEGDGYSYFYGKGGSSSFTLTMMLCDQLPKGLLERLIERGDLEGDLDDPESCTVKTVRGLTDAARAYHKGNVLGDEKMSTLITPARDAAE